MNKHQLWETLFFQRGKDYLEERLVHYQQLLEKEEEEKAFEMRLPGSQFKDLSFYDIQIGDLAETIEIIRKIIFGNSKKNYNPQYGEKINNLDIKRSNENQITTNNNWNNDTKIQNNPKNNYSNTNQLINQKKLQINYLRIIWIFLSGVLSVSLLIDFFNSSYSFPAWKWIFYLILLVSIIILGLKDKKFLKGKNFNLNNRYYDLLAKKLICISNGTSITGVYKGHKIKIYNSVQNNKPVTKLNILCYRKKISSFWISTNDKQNTGMKRMFSDRFIFDSHYKIYTDDVYFVKSILTDDIANLLLNYLKYHKSFEFSFFENTLAYSNSNSTMNSKNDLNFYMDLIGMLLKIAKIIDNTK